jgi:hypothetical protein
MFIHRPVGPQGHIEMKVGCEVIVFRVHRESDGLYTATSPQLAGVFVSHRNMDSIVEDMPNIIRLWFRRHRNMDVEVLMGRTTQADDSTSYFIGTVPAEIADQALRR